MPSSPSRAFWLPLTLPAAAVVVALAPLPPAHVERMYAQAFYPSIQPLITISSNLLPFAALDAMVAAAAVWTAWRTARRWRTRTHVVRAAGLLLRDLAIGAACVYLVFAAFWGLNYQRSPAEERFGVDRGRVTETNLRRLGDVAVARINTLYDRRRDETGLALESLALELQPPFMRALERIGQPWRPAAGRPKPSLVAHLFPLAAVDGMMNPLALEVIVNPDVLPFERPFLLAHEWAHLAGHARESEASFVAWLACLEGSPAMQYSGWMAAALHVARSLPDGRGLLAATLDEGPRSDLDAIRRRLTRTHPLVSRATWRVYDRYLRAHRVDSGVANYDEVTILLLGSEVATRLVSPLEPAPSREPSP